MSFFESNHCTSRAHCVSCRATTSQSFRRAIAAAYSLPIIDFDCPHGVEWNTPERVAPPLSTPTAQTARLGDALAALFRRCGIRKRPGCGCGARQSWLNEHQSTALLIVGIAAFVAFSGVLAAWLA